jgi:hypothetical protein
MVSSGDWPPADLNSDFKGNDGDRRAGVTTAPPLAGKRERLRGKARGLLIFAIELLISY